MEHGREDMAAKNKRGIAFAMPLNRPGSPSLRHPAAFRPAVDRGNSKPCTRPLRRKDWRDQADGTSQTDGRDSWITDSEGPIFPTFLSFLFFLVKPPRLPDTAA